MVEQSLLHVTLNTNRRGHSPRSEASPEAIDLLSGHDMNSRGQITCLIQKSEFAIPGQAAYRCDVFEPGGRCPCFQALDAHGVSQGRAALQSLHLSPRVLFHSVWKL